MKKLFIFPSIIFLIFLLITCQAVSQNPSGDFEQARNGRFSNPKSPVQWQTGNINQSQAHMNEDYSIPYRLVMENMPVDSVVLLQLEFNTRHSGANAIDFVTSFNNLVSHDPWGHPAEVIDPVSGNPSLLGFPEVHIPITMPGLTNGQNPTGLFLTNPTTLADFWLNFNNRKPGKDYMSLWGGTIENISVPFEYVFEHALTASITTTRILVRFKVQNETMVLSWGGHIARQEDWGAGNSASGIHGSPYHSTTVLWNIGNLGNHDRSMHAMNVIPTFDCNFTVPSPVCTNSMVTATKDDPVDPEAVYSWTINTLSGTSPAPVSGTGSTFSFNAGPSSGTFTLNLTTTKPFDSSNLSTTCSKTVTVNINASQCSITAGTTPPYCPGSTHSFSGPPGMSTYAWSITGNGSITGAADQSSVTVTSGDTCGSNFTLTLNTAGTNACGTNCQQSYLVQDLSDPVFSGVPADTIPLGCNPALPTCAGVLALVTASDACKGAITPTCNPGNVSINGCQYSQSFTLTATDDCQNTASCTVSYSWTEDHQAPQIISSANSSLFGCNATFTDPIFSGTDNCMGSFVPDVVTTGPISANGCDFTQSWTATFTDACNNPATPVVVTYSWKTDTIKPEIINNSPGLATYCNPTVTPPQFTGLDNCQGGFVPNVTPGSLLGCQCFNSQSWIANFTDDCGNHAIPVMVTYNWVQDTEPPVITTSAFSHDLGVNPEITAPSFQGNDFCEGPFIPEVATQGPVNTSGNNWMQSWTATHTDNCGNPAVPITITYTWRIVIIQ
ncbi:MAG: hypothetical protein ACM3N9_04135 [Syntrophothermus sp.]